MESSFSQPQQQLVDSEDNNSETMHNNLVYSMASQLEQIRQMEDGEPLQRIISTASTKEQVDSPSPNPFCFTNSTSVLASSDSLQSTIINEKLYRPLVTHQMQDGDPTYAQIRPTAIREGQRGKSQEFLGSPTRKSMFQFRTGNHRYHSEQTMLPLPDQRRSTLPARISPVHYTEPHSQIPHIKNHRVVAIGTMASIPAQPQSRPKPVSSISSVRTAGNWHHAESRRSSRTVSSQREISNTQQSSLTSPLHSVDKGGSSQQWYTNEDSDIVTPTSHMTYSNDTTIEPYASTPSSLIKASPYSQPGTDWQSTVDSNYPASSSQQEEPKNECTFKTIHV